MAKQQSGNQTSSGIARSAGRSATTRESHSSQETSGAVHSAARGGAGTSYSRGKSEGASHTQTAESRHAGAGANGIGGSKSASADVTHSTGSTNSTFSSNSTMSEGRQARSAHPDMGATSEQLRTYDVKGDVIRQVTEVSVVDKNGYERVAVTQSEHTSKEGGLKSAVFTAEQEATSASSGVSAGKTHSASSSEHSSTNEAFNARSEAASPSPRVSAGESHVVSTTAGESVSTSGSREGGYQSRSSHSQDVSSYSAETGDTNRTRSSSENISATKEVDGVRYDSSSATSEILRTDVQSGATVKETAHSTEETVSRRMAENVTHSVSNTRSSHTAENTATGEMYQYGDEKRIESVIDTRAIDGNVYSTSQTSVENVSHSSRGSGASADLSESFGHSVSSGVSSSSVKDFGASVASSHGESIGHSHSVSSGVSSSSVKDFGASVASSHGESIGHSVSSGVSSSIPTSLSDSVAEFGRSSTSSHAENVGHSVSSGVSTGANASRSELVKDFGGSATASPGVNIGHSVSAGMSAGVTEALGRAATDLGGSMTSSNRESTTQSSSKSASSTHTQEEKPSSGPQAESASHQNVSNAIEQHLSTHSERGATSEVAAQAGALASSALEAIGDRKERGADLKEEAFDLSNGKIEASSEKGLHGVSLETLNFVAQHGFSPTAVHELVSNLGTEAHGHSHLQLADRVGASELADMGANGFPSEKVSAIQEVAAGLGAAAGVKDMALTKLEGLELLKEIEAPANAGGVFFADAKNGQDVALGVMSKDEFAKSPSVLGAAVADVRASFGELAQAHDIGGQPDPAKAQKESESAHQAEAQMVMAMSS